MKYKLTKKHNAKVTMTAYEASVITAILSHVRLGDGEASKVALDWLETFEGRVIERDFIVSFTYNEDEGHVINV